MQKVGQKIALDVQKTVSVILYPDMPYIHHYVLHSQAAAGSICVLIYTYYDHRRQYQLVSVLFLACDPRAPPPSPLLAKH